MENGTGNALSDSHSHTLNGNLNKKHPHHCSLTPSLTHTHTLLIVSFGNLVRCVAGTLYIYS